MALHLHGVGHFHPENEITNQFLEDLDIGTSDAWIMERVGIRTRRTTLPLDYIRETRNSDPRMAAEAMLYGNAETGRRAAEMAIARAGIDPQDIGMVISGSCAPDVVTPAEACTVAAALGLEVPSFDVNSACTSFHVAMNLLSMMDPDKVPRFVLSVVPEGLTRTVDYNDRSAAVLWGDGAAAAVLSTREPGRARILGNTLEGSPAGHAQGAHRPPGPLPPGGADGADVRHQEDRAAASERLREDFEEDGRRLHFVGHQANRLMLEKVCELCDVPPDRHHHNVQSYGNTAGAGSPSVHQHAVGRLDRRRRRRGGGRGGRADLVGLPGALRRAAVRYDDFRGRSSFDHQELLAFAHGRLVEDPPEAFKAKLPLPPMLMVDRIGEISRERNQGRIVAERDVRLDDWFFQCHFLGDPVQPGCLGVDGVWQLIGFFCAWAGGMGTGRALGCSEVEFAGQIRPRDTVMRYEIDIVRYQELKASGSAVAVGDATVAVDGEVIYDIKRAKVGIFRDIDYADYPWPSKRSRGGRMER